MRTPSRFTPAFLVCLAAACSSDLITGTLPRVPEGPHRAVSGGSVSRYAQVPVKYPDGKVRTFSTLAPEAQRALGGAFDRLSNGGTTIPWSCSYFEGAGWWMVRCGDFTSGCWVDYVHTVDGPYVDSNCFGIRTFASRMREETVG